MSLNPLKWLIPRRWRQQGPLVTVVRLAGTIGVVTPLRPGLSLSTTAGILDRAFSAKGVKAVAIQVNSPGGSAVQSMLIFKRIRALAEEKDLPVYIFAEDVAASGGYMIALAGDEIYADASSIIGSIGVVASGFGFEKAIEKIGIERRVYTAGERKMSLDPFRPENPDDIERLKAIQADVHETFISLVKERRGRRIRKAGDTLFTGEFWSGNKALELGLIDGITDLRTKMREMLGDKVRLKLVSPERGLFRRRMRGVFSGSAGDWQETGFARPSFADELVSAVEARSIWSRYGL
ncbi:MAG: S49 family peptidase [Hyphomicrobiales bacterium]|nr:S49 family peptidase [Hyphomicrobiales bacterium]